MKKKSKQTKIKEESKPKVAAKKEPEQEYYCLMDCLMTAAEFTGNNSDRLQITFQIDKSKIGDWRICESKII